MHFKLKFDTEQKRNKYAMVLTGVSGLVERDPGWHRYVQQRETLMTFVRTKQKNEKKSLI